MRAQAESLAAPVRAADRVVTIGVDAVDDSATALRWALDYARRIEAAVRVVHVWRWTPTVPAALSTDLTPDWPDSGRSHARREVDAVVQEALGAGLDGAGLDIALVESGHVGEALVQAARGAHLLVIGRHDQGGRATLGGTGRYVTLHCGCPVVVVPTGATGRELGSPITFFDPRR
jgi:nucleotide-binding universal stress UspA family protein